jgi:chromosome segregation ATPase
MQESHHDCIHPWRWKLIEVLRQRAMQEKQAMDYQKKIDQVNETTEEEEIEVLEEVIEVLKSKLQKESTHPIERELNSLQEALDVSQKKITVLETDNEYLNKKNTESEDALKTLLQQLVKLEASVKENNKKLKQKDEESNGLKVYLTQMVEERKGDRNQLEENEDEIEQLQEKVQKQTDQIQIQQSELRSLKETKEIQAQKIVEFQEKIRKLTPSPEDCVKYLKLIQDEEDTKMFFVSANSYDARNRKYLKKFVFPVKMNMKKVIVGVFDSFHLDKSRFDELVTFIPAHHPILEDPPAPAPTTRTRKNSVKRSNSKPKVE